MNIPKSTERVEKHTDPQINETIRRKTECRLAYYAGCGDTAAIDRRLEELDREWDIERVLEANAATVALLGLTLGAAKNRTWFLLPAVVSGFLLQHALQGWCPPLPVFRRLGFRTPAEIDRERYALKAIRGDFNRRLEGNGSAAHRAQEAFRAASE